MKQTAISTMEPSGDGQKGMTSVFHSLNPIERTGAQINILRAALDTCHDFLMTSRSATEGFEVDEETKGEARRTACLLFAQMRNIVDDQPRWANDNGEAEREAKKLLEAEVDKAQSDAFLKDQLARPFHMLKARIHRTASGKLVAVNDTQSVVGFGDTAVEAMDAFDEAFFEGRHLPQAQPEAAPAPAPAKKTPKTRKKQ